MNWRTIAKRRARRFETRAFAKQEGIYAEETYNLDATILNFVIPRLKVFKKATICYPHSLTPEEWDNVLQEIIDGFELYYKSDIDITEEDNAKIERALDLFRQYFRDLWW